MPRLPFVPRFSFPPLDTAPAVTYPLGLDTTITGRQLLGGTLILGDMAEAKPFLAQLACHATSLVTISDEGSFLAYDPVTAHAAERLTPPLDLDVTLTRLCRWRAEHSPAYAPQGPPTLLGQWRVQPPLVYHPDAPPTLLLISLAEPDLQTLARWQPALQGHNFATVLRLSPQQAKPIMPRFRNFIVCPQAHAWASRYIALNLPPPPCLVRWSEEIRTIR